MRDTLHTARAPGGRIKFIVVQQGSRFVVYRAERPVTLWLVRLHTGEGFETLDEAINRADQLAERMAAA
jgi:hypothetical protein